MKEQILLAPMETQRRKFWKRWKWIGLAVYATALLFNQSLPGIVVAAAYIYGIVVIGSLIFFCLQYLKDKLFWRVRNRLIGSFIFVGVIPLLIILGLFAIALRVTLGQLAGNYLGNALRENISLISEGIQLLEATGMVVGLFPDMAYQAASIDLAPGTMLAIFTDGITEALNKADEEFGDIQLQAALRQSRMRSPEGVWKYVMSKVGEWQSDLPQYDDITLIVAKAG